MRSEKHKLLEFISFIVFSNRFVVGILYFIFVYSVEETLISSICMNIVAPHKYRIHFKSDLIMCKSSHMR